MMIKMCDKPKPRRMFIEEMEDALTEQRCKINEVIDEVNTILDKLERGTPHMAQTLERIRKLEKEVEHLGKLVEPWKHGGV